MVALAEQLRGVREHLPGPWHHMDRKTQADKFEEVLLTTLKHLPKKERGLLEAKEEDPVFTAILKGGKDIGIVEDDAYEILKKHGYQNGNFSWALGESEKVFSQRFGELTFKTAIHENDRYPNSVFALRHGFKPDGSRAAILISVRVRTKYEDSLLASHIASPNDGVLSEPFTPLSNPRRLEPSSPSL